MRLLAATLMMLVTVAGHAQAPVEDARQSQDTLQRAQQKAGAAYHDLQQAEFATKRAEQDYAQSRSRTQDRAKTRR